MSKNCEQIIRNVRIASMQNNGRAYGEITNGCVAISENKIVYVGDHNQCPYQSDHMFDGNNHWLTPGLIDCHTHLVYGGNRAQEFEQRLQGVSYADIAKAGGGIQSTVNATRNTNAETLLKQALKRAKRLSEEGVTCIEIKSGYGLDFDTEIKMLKVAKQLEQHLPISVETTYLGAHSVPAEFKHNADDYVDFVCHTMIPQIAQQQLASCVDVFCETIGFTPVQCERVFLAAKQHGLEVKAHVEQLSDLKGAKLACQFKALSVDHLEYLDSNDIHFLKQAGSVAVLLPGAFYYLNETFKPPVAELRAQQVPMAVATDLNPGSSPVASLLTVMNMACVLFGLTAEEALQGTTINAAKALGQDSKGVLAKNFDADMCLWDIDHPSEIVYGINQLRPECVWHQGQLCHF